MYGAIYDRGALLSTAVRANVWFRTDGGNCRTELKPLVPVCWPFLHATTKSLNCLQQLVHNFLIPVRRSYAFKNATFVGHHFEKLPGLMRLLWEEESDTRLKKRWHISCCRGRFDSLIVSEMFILRLEAAITVGFLLWGGADASAKAGTVCNVDGGAESLTKTFEKGGVGLKNPCFDEPRQRDLLS